MTRRIVLTCAVSFAFAGLALAQTKISGTSQCAKAEVEHSIDVGDQPNHAYAINQTKCTWTKPLDFGTSQSAHSGEADR